MSVRLGQADVRRDVLIGNTDHLAVVEKPLVLLVGAVAIDPVILAVGVSLGAQQDGIAAAAAGADGEYLPAFERDAAALVAAFFIFDDRLDPGIAGNLVHDIRISLELLVDLVAQAGKLVEGPLGRDPEEIEFAQTEGHEVGIGSIDAGEYGRAALALRGTPAGLGPGNTVETVPPDAVFDLQGRDGSGGFDPQPVAVGHPGRGAVRTHLDRPVIGFVLFVVAHADNGRNAVGSAAQDQRRSAGEGDAVGLATVFRKFRDTGDMVVLLQGGDQVGKRGNAAVELRNALFQGHDVIFQTGDPFVEVFVAGGRQQGDKRQKQDIQLFFHDLGPPYDCVVLGCLASMVITTVFRAPRPFEMSRLSLLLAGGAKPAGAVTLIFQLLRSLVEAVA